MFCPCRLAPLLTRTSCRRLSCCFSHSCDPSPASSPASDQLQPAEQPRPAVILGIETSCDDTGCAVVTTDGRLLANCVRSQQSTHLRNGGVIPSLARQMHADCIEELMAETLCSAGVFCGGGAPSVDAIAVTVQPGLSMSLMVGLMYAKYLCSGGVVRARDGSIPDVGRSLVVENNGGVRIPLIPVHHMEAHALAARLSPGSVPFPFLALLVSGGHAQLVLVSAADDFRLLGTSQDNAPGQILDRVARRLRLRNIRHLSNMSGGRALEQLARAGRVDVFDDVPTPMSQAFDCHFSFSGMLSWTLKLIEREEQRFDLDPTDVLPNAADICATVQHMVAVHLCRRTQRALQYCFMNELLVAPSSDDEGDADNRPCLVLSGGVACNRYMATCLEHVCDSQDVRLVVPPPWLCCDNGAMVAWNGAEKWLLQRDIVYDLDAVRFEPRAALGVDVSADLKRHHLKCHGIKLDWREMAARCRYDD